MTILNIKVKSPCMKRVTPQRYYECITSILQPITSASVSVNRKFTGISNKEYTLYNVANFDSVSQESDVWRKYKKSPVFSLGVTQENELVISKVFLVEGENIDNISECEYHITFHNTVTHLTNQKARYYIDCSEPTPVLKQMSKYNYPTNTTTPYHIKYKRYNDPIDVIDLLELIRLVNKMCLETSPTIETSDRPPIAITPIITTPKSITPKAITPTPSMAFTRAAEMEERIKIVIDVLKKKNRLSLTDISRYTGYSNALLGNVMKVLEDKHMVIKTGSIKNRQYTLSLPSVVDTEKDIDTELDTDTERDVDTELDTDTERAKSADLVRVRVRDKLYTHKPKVPPRMHRNSRVLAGKVLENSRAKLREHISQDVIKALKNHGWVSLTTLLPLVANILPGVNLTGVLNEVLRSLYDKHIIDEKKEISQTYFKLIHDSHKDAEIDIDTELDTDYDTDTE